MQPVFEILLYVYNTTLYLKAEREKYDNDFKFEWLIVLYDLEINQNIILISLIQGFDAESHPHNYEKSCKVRYKTALVQYWGKIVSSEQCCEPDSIWTL